MVKIKNVSSFRNQVFVEHDEGIIWLLFNCEEGVPTTEDIRNRLKVFLEEERLRQKAMEEKTITPSLQHLKELEGEEIE